MDKRLIKESIECAKKSAERYRHLAENMQGEGCHRIIEDMENDARQHAECLAEILDEEPGEKLSDWEITRWNERMENEDGSVGGHWSLMQTNTYADNIGVRFEHITPKEWNVTMNMMYSDYCRVANKYGSGMSDFYAYMAKAFLFDKDAPSPKEKLAAYYHSIAEK